MSKEKKIKKEKKGLTHEEEVEVFKEINDLAKELGFNGPVGLKNTLWAHINELRSFEEEIKKLKKFFSDSLKVIEVQKAEFFEMNLNFQKNGMDIINVLSKISDLLGRKIKIIKENEKME